MIAFKLPSFLLTNLGFNFLSYNFFFLIVKLNLQQIFKLNWYVFKTRNVDIFSILSVHKPPLGTIKVIMQGKLFQMCTHLLYCSVLSLGDNINTRRMSQPEMGSWHGIHLSHKKSMKYSGERKILCELS